MGGLIKYLVELFVEMPWWGQLLTVVLVLALALIISLRFVKEGERGLVLRFGQVVRKGGKPRIIEPGFVFLIPQVENLVRRHVRQQTIELNEQEVILKDNTIWVVSAVVFFRVKDIYKALFEIDDLDGGVRNLCMGELRTVLQHLPTVRRHQGDRRRLARADGIGCQARRRVGHRDHRFPADQLHADAGDGNVRNGTDGGISSREGAAGGERDARSPARRGAAGCARGCRARPAFRQRQGQRPLARVRARRRARDELSHSGLPEPLPRLDGIHGVRRPAEADPAGSPARCGRKRSGRHDKALI